MDKKELIFIDTETTGLLEPVGCKLDFQPYVYEIYILRTTAKLKTIDTFYSLINIPVEIPSFLSRMTCVYNTDLKKKPLFNEVKKPIKNIIKDASLFVAHNATFDKEMVNIEFKRNGIDDFKFPSLYCMVEQSYHLKGYRLTQGELYNLLTGEQYNQEKQHRAKVDVEKMLENYRILNNIRNKKNVA